LLISPPYCKHLAQNHPKIKQDMAQSKSGQYQMKEGTWQYMIFEAKKKGKVIKPVLIPSRNNPF
jgi:hypothetical protein